MSIAMGRDPEADALLKVSDPPVRLAIPSVCYMEAFSTMKHELWLRKNFKLELDRQMTQLERDRISPHVKSLLVSLNESRVALQNYLDDVGTRFNGAIDQLSRKAESIETNPTVIQECLHRDYLNDPTDNLIVCNIMEHARAHPSDTKAFLSGNTKDFGGEEIRKEFRGAGIEKYFAGAQNIMDWLRSLPAS
jgi:hypothetical protein